MNWLSYSILTIVLYGLHDVLLKHLSDNTNALLASFIINLSAGVCLLAILVYMYFHRQNALHLSGEESAMLALAGVCLGLATVTFMRAFGSGGDFSVVVPFVYVGIIVISLLVGVLVFHERITPVKLLGLVLSSVGIVLMVKK